MYLFGMRVEESQSSSTSRAIYESQQAAQKEALNRVEPVQKDQPAQATGTASAIDTYA
jgi:hypothetical protein